MHLCAVKENMFRAFFFFYALSRHLDFLRSAYQSWLQGLIWMSFNLYEVYNIIYKDHMQAAYSSVIIISVSTRYIWS